MGRRHADWLDATACRLTGTVAGEPRQRDTGRASSDARFSRAFAVKYVLAGAASMSLGLWSARDAQGAGDYDACIISCFERRGEDHEQATKACRRLYQAKWFKRAGNSRWAAFKELLKSGGPMEWLKAYSDQGLLFNCLQRANNRFAESLDRCEDGCEETCPKERSTQSVLRETQACEPAPPPPPYTPSPPRAPTYSEDPCWAYVEAGGMACGTCPDGSCKGVPKGIGQTCADARCGS